MSDFHALNIERIFHKIKSSSEGLSEKEVERRRGKYGVNELPREKPLGKLTIFFSQFKNPLIYILLGAGVISFLLRDWVDMGVIFGAVFLNTIIGFIQENKANNTLNKLKQLIKYKAEVLRDGKEREIDSRELVVGDIVIIKSGNRVPADGRLIEADNLLVNESALTGESVPSEKNTEIQKIGAGLADRSNMIYASTIIARGSGRAIITAIGAKTEIGKIAILIKDTREEKTPLQTRLAKFSNLLGILVGIVTILIILAGLIQGRPLLEMFITGVALAVSAIPEGLIVAVTVILVLGMQRILEKKSLVKKLIAAETLGSTTVICSDKTGTLTEGEMHVAHIVIGEKEFEMESLGSRQDHEEARAVSLALQTAMMCNDAIVENPEDELASWRIIGDPTESALMSAAIQSGLDKGKLLKIEPEICRLPFLSEDKFMITFHKKKGGGGVIYEKGAPEKLLDKSRSFYHKNQIRKITPEERKKLDDTHEKLTSKGLRVIAVATREVASDSCPSKKEATAWQEIDKDLIFIGFIAIKDPLRPEARETIELCRQAGIRPIIITGDNKLTARAIAEEVGLKVKAENIATGEYLDEISDEKLESQIKKIDIYARVSPHHKLRIVRALQAKGEVVAMTGDGINDSPALKVADIGISLGTGTDIAKETSDIILLDNNFRTIVEAVKQGRIIFANIQKVITYLTFDGFTEVMLILGSIILGAPLAMLPTQILWINIINDGLPNFSLAFEKGAKGVMSEKPIKKDEPILSSKMKAIIFGAGFARNLLFLSIFALLLKTNMEVAYLRTLIFACLGTSSLLSIFSIRDLNVHIWSINPFSNIHLVSTVMASFGLLLGAIYWAPLQKVLSTISLNLDAWISVVSVSVVSVLLIEISKHHFILKEKKKLEI